MEKSMALIRRCSVNDPVAESAEAAARDLIDESGWDVEELDDWAPMNVGGAPGPRVSY